MLLGIIHFRYHSRVALSLVKYGIEMHDFCFDAVEDDHQFLALGNLSSIQCMHDSTTNNYQKSILKNLNAFVLVTTTKSCTSAPFALICVRNSAD